MNHLFGLPIRQMLDSQVTSFKGLLDTFEKRCNSTKKVIRNQLP